MTKEDLYLFCKEYVGERLARNQQAIRDVQESLASETKSSAGDKHETGRAMLQLEREKLGQQLVEIEHTTKVFQKIKLANTGDIIRLGSWIKTSKADYFLAISAGLCKTNNQAVYCVSALTPIGKQLMGKKVGDSIEFNFETIKILEIK